MRFNRIYSLWSLSSVYLFVFISLGVWAYFSYQTMIRQIDLQNRYAKLINLSGKQRMLSQKTTLIAKRILETQDQFFIDHNRDLIQTMKEDHLFIINNLKSKTMNKIYFEEPFDLDRKVNQYFSLLDEFSMLQNTQTIQKVQNYSFKLLPQLNHAVNEFEKESTQGTQELKQRQLLIFFGTLFTLIFEGFFIVLPTLRKVKRKEKLLEEEKSRSQQASQAKSEFLANMSHEIRTPLNAIVGFIDFLKEEETNSKKLKYIQTIQSSSMNLLEIINDILDFSKIESNKLLIEYIDFSPNREFKTLKKLFKTKLDEKNIKLHSSYNKLPQSLYGDPLRIKQVINNLLSNAIKFTPEGKNIYLDISYENNSLSVHVKDEGIGISKEYLNDIFKPFTQADSSTTRKYGGSGLGLTICYQLIKLMDGELSVKSTTDVGSEFYFSIPLKIGKEIQIKFEDTTKEKFEAKLLLVEDNKANQMFMKVLLKKYGLSFDIANDGEEAVNIYKNDSSYDLILMDENMPNMSGIEATKQIRKFEKDNTLSYTPIVALTANAIKGDRERFLEAGMDEYLTKPLDKEKFKGILEQFV